MNASPSKTIPSELNEIIRQFPFTEDEAFRDSIQGSLFNIGKIYQQIEHNDSLYPNPVVQGNFVWRKKMKRLLSLQILTVGLAFPGCLRQI